MKRLLTATLFALMTLPAILNAASLWPASHQTCPADSEVTPRCDVGEYFFKASDGRCGCLSEEEYTPMRICMVALFSCTDEAPYSGIREHNGDRVGCGCFTTEE